MGPDLRERWVGWVGDAFVRREVHQDRRIVRAGSARRFSDLSPEAFNLSADFPVNSPYFRIPLLAVGAMPQQFAARHGLWSQTAGPPTRTR
jgi:hypothetical protein